MGKVFLLILSLFGIVGNAMAQTCPSVLVGNTQLKQNIAGWEVGTPDERYVLMGMTVIEGPMASRVTGSAASEAELAPNVMNGTQMWRFDKAVGDTEIWMRCWYSGTSLTVSSRIGSDVIECIRKEERVSAETRKSRIVAMCTAMDSRMKRVK